jgi:hypothetical protein
MRLAVRVVGQYDSIDMLSKDIRLVSNRLSISFRFKEAFRGEYKIPSAEFVSEDFHRERLEGSCKDHNKHYSVLANAAGNPQVAMLNFRFGIGSGRRHRYPAATADLL